MAVNTMTFNQLATVLSSIVSQATGKTVLTPTDTASFVSVGKLALETGYDPLNNAISQVLSKTIFSVRPYESKFRGLERDSIRWGNHVRKINFCDNQVEEDDSFKLVDGQSIDMQTVKKPKVFQTNFYGTNIWQHSVTIYKNQLDCAFSSPDEFARFVSGVMQNVTDVMEQERENTARATIANLIGGHYKLDDLGLTKGCVVHLLTEYNAWSGESVTAATVFNPDVFPAFAKWLYGRLATISRMMQERSALYHLNFDDYTVMRHTPVANQNLYLLAQNMDQVSTNVLSSVYNDEYLRTIPRSEVSFWQSIQAPAAINVDAGYVDENGDTAHAVVSLDNVFGVIFDDEAAGYTEVGEWSSPAPFNAKGGYTNYFYHANLRYYSDYSENCVVLVLD